MSPSGNSILITGIKLKNNDKPYSFFVIDDKGKSLITRQTSLSQDKDTFNLNLQFIKNEDVINDITLIPYIAKYKDDSENELIKSNSIIKLPQTLDIGNKGKITFNSITLNDNSTIVDYSINGYTINYDVIFLLDENGNKIRPKEGAREMLINSKKGEYQIEFSKIIKGKPIDLQLLKIIQPKY